MTAPKLHYIAPAEQEFRYLLSHSIIWNSLDANTGNVDAWNRLFAKNARIQSPSRVPEGIVMPGGVDCDFWPTCRKTFSIAKRLWARLQKRVDESVEAIPIVLKRDAELETFQFPKRPKGRQRERMMLRSRRDVPMRHGQSGYFDTRRRRYDMGLSSVSGAVDPEATKLLFLDPEEFSGLELFTIKGEWIATDSFVSWYERSKLTGLEFHAFRYAVRSRPEPLCLKKQMPKAPDIDLSDTPRYSAKLANQWRAKWDWLYEALRNRKWKPKKVRFKPPLEPAVLKRFEERHHVKLPTDFVHVLTRLARSATIDFGKVDVTDPAYPDWDDFLRTMPDLIYWFERPLWSFDYIKQEYPRYHPWTESWADEDEISEYHEHFRGKIPIQGIGNGDYVALDEKTGVPVYLSHDGDRSLQGMPLASNFVDLISRWTHAGLPRLDFMPDTSFYDNDQQRIASDQDSVIKLHEWLSGVSGVPG